MSAAVYWVCNWHTSLTALVVPTIARLIELATVFDCDAADLLTESSTRPTVQASHIGALLVELKHADRQLVLELVERLVERLKQA